MNIFFDLDGALIDVSEKYYRVYFDFMRQYNKHPLSKKKFWQSVRGRQGAEAVVHNAALVPQYKKHFLRHIETPQYLRYDALYRFTLPTLHFLR